MQNSQKIRSYLFYLMKSGTILFRQDQARKAPLRNFPFLKQAYWSVLSYLKPSIVLILGSRMFLDCEDRLLLSIYDIFEPLETKLFKNTVKKGNVVLDIGAHIGYYTLLASRLVGSKGKVYAFEPNRTRFSILLDNIKLNSYKNITAINKGVLNQNGIKKLFIYYDGEKLITETISLDSFFNNETIRIDVVKIDIDGADVLAIKGMLNLLKKNKNIILFLEFWPAGLSKFGSSAKEYLEILSRLGFKIYNINEKEGEFELVTTEELLRTYTIKNNNHTNLLCSKKLPRSKEF